MNKIARGLVCACFAVLIQSIILILVAIRPGQADTTLSAQLETLWSTPITTEMNSDGTFGRSQGLVLNSGAIGPTGNVVFLGSILGGQHPGRVFLFQADGTEPYSATPLRLPTSNGGTLQSIKAWVLGLQTPIRDRAILTFVYGPQGSIWLGGLSNSYLGMASDAHSNAYLAKLDGRGVFEWEQSYGKDDLLDLESLASAPSGGLVGVGHAWGESWFASFATDGALKAERRFGNGKGAAVVALTNGKFLVAGISNENAGAVYEDSVSVWVFDAAGDNHGPIRVRTELSRSSGGHFGHVTEVPVADGAYVASNWSDMFHPQAVEVARMDPDNGILWRHRLPDTVGDPKQAKVTTYDACDPALATLDDGDALVACALHGQIQLYRLNRDTGEVKSVRLSLPECQRTHPATLFLMPRHDGTVFLGGSRPASNVAGNCSWLGTADPAIRVTAYQRSLFVRLSVLSCPFYGVTPKPERS